MKQWPDVVEFCAGGAIRQDAKPDFDAACSGDGNELPAGLAWWDNGHRFNLELAGPVAIPARCD